MEGSPFAIDRVFAVVLRAGSGPFEQESLVYQGLPAMPSPFVDVDTVEVRVGSQCRYRSAVAAGTLAVDPVHHPLQVGAG